VILNFIDSTHRVNKGRHTAMSVNFKKILLQISGPTCPKLLGLSLVVELVQLNSSRTVSLLNIVSFISIQTREGNKDSFLNNIAQVYSINLSKEKPRSMIVHNISDL
jgi:hypothetical protein